MVKGEGQRWDIYFPASIPSCTIDKKHPILTRTSGPALCPGLLTSHLSYAHDMVLVSPFRVSSKSLAKGLNTQYILLPSPSYPNYLPALVTTLLLRVSLIYRGSPRCFDKNYDCAGQQKLVVIKTKLVPGVRYLCDRPDQDVQGRM